MKNKFSRILQILIFSILTIGASLNAETDPKLFINYHNCDQVIHKTKYDICYNYKMKCASFEIYNLTTTNNPGIKQRPDFYTEPSIPKKYQVNNSYYQNSGFDKGHIASDASFDDNQSTLYEVYTLANIFPQLPDTNRNPFIWEGIEKFERSLALNNRITVIDVLEFKDSKYKLKDITIPTSISKIIITKNKDYCFKVPNQKLEQFDSQLSKHNINAWLIDCNTLKINK
jgi:endonuclease G